MNLLKATFRHNPSDYKILYRQSKATLLISVGMAYHENDKFFATIDALNQSNFNHCSIVVGDVIQRYNLGFNQNSTLDELSTEARFYGDLWLERNQHIYSRLNIPYNILRWDYWLAHSDYQQFKEKIDFLYQTDVDVRNAFRISATKYLIRYSKLNPANYDYGRVFNYSILYLLEEATIIMMLFVKEGFQFVIYPSKILEALDIINQKLTLPWFGKSLQWLQLRFKHLANIVTSKTE